LELTIDTEILDARTFTYRPWQVLKITMIGCGGNGSWLAPHLVRLVKMMQDYYEGRGADKIVELNFVDDDIVEAGNIPRQNFCQAEVGLNKAVTLALRYGGAWGVDVRAYPRRFTADLYPSIKNRGTSNYGKQLSLIIGCVDNAVARQEIHNTMAHEFNSTRQGYDYDYYPNQEVASGWWLDLGNTAQAGQVLMGSASHKQNMVKAFELDKYCFHFPLPSFQHPELLVPLADETGPDPLSCAAITQADAQSVMINQMVAAVAGDYLLKFLFTGTLNRYATYLDLASGSMRSYYASMERAYEVVNRNEAEVSRIMTQLSNERREQAQAAERARMEEMAQNGRLWRQDPQVPLVAADDEEDFEEEDDDDDNEDDEFEDELARRVAELPNG
jgi:PRTRC genetic system ThiF family protein